jgi:uncharacterized membrane protein
VPTNKELRAVAREQLNGRWGNPVLASLIYFVLFAIASIIPKVGGAISFLLTGPVFLGFVTYFLNFKREKNPKIADVFCGFKNVGSALLLNLLICIFVLLWSLLLIIPGIIACLKYSMAYFILSDNPNIGAMEAINKSKEIMDGNKKQLLMLWLSFIGWGLCCILTLGIGFLWLLPYIKISMVNFYEYLIKTKQEGRSELAIS